MFCPNPLLRLLLLFVALLMGGQAAATVTPALRDLSVLVDPQGDMDISAIASAADQRFKPLATGLVAGYTSNVNWLRFTIAAPKGEWWLDILPPYLDDLRLYEPDPLHPGAFLERRAGDQLPFSAREVDYRGFVFKIHTPAHRFLCRACGHQTTFMPPWCWTTVS